MFILDTFLRNTCSYTSRYVIKATNDSGSCITFTWRMYKICKYIHFMFYICYVTFVEKIQ